MAGWLFRRVSLKRQAASSPSSCFRLIRSFEEMVLELSFHFE